MLPRFGKKFLATTILMCGGRGKAKSNKHPVSYLGMQYKKILTEGTHIVKMVIRERPRGK